METGLRPLLRQSLQPLTLDLKPNLRLSEICVRMPAYIHVSLLTSKPQIGILKMAHCLLPLDTFPQAQPFQWHALVTSIARHKQ